MNRPLCTSLLSLAGAVLIILAVVLGWLILPSVVEQKINEQIRLVEGSDTWEKWKEAPIPIYMDFYIHHVTNPDEVEDGLKPVFQEKGPYIYRQHRKKVDIEQEDGPNTVKYRQVVTFYFDQGRSGNNSEDDLVNVPNIPFVAVLNTVHRRVPINLITGLVGNFVLAQEKLIRRDVPVRELLFDGFDVTRYTDGLLGRRLPESFSGGRFGLYKGRNGTASKEFEIYTGHDDSSNFGKIKSWDGKSELGIWRPHTKCDKIRGTDGSIFRPFLNKSSVLDIFGPDLCSTVSIRYEKDIEFQGVTGYRFQTPKPKTDGPVPESRQCFCLEEDPDKCPLAGVLSLESCMKAPIYSSMPYFLNADIRYWAQSGLAKPDRGKHGTFVDLEPTTGLVLRAHKRVQINIEVKKNNMVRALRHLTQDSMLFPVIWVDENAELTEEIIANLNTTLFIPLKIIEIGKWVGIGLGLLLLLLGLLTFFRRSPEEWNGERKSSLNGIRGGEIPLESDISHVKIAPIEKGSIKQYNHNLNGSSVFSVSTATSQFST